MKEIEAVKMDSPVGPLTLGVRQEKLVMLRFGLPEDDRGLIWRDSAPRFERALKAYFGGELTALSELPIAPEGTAFYKRVWKELQKIPPKETISYHELARRVESPQAFRAVAQANAKNPIAIVVPCHRVIAKDGHLRGFGGGLPAKRWLLEHEGHKIDGRLFLNTAQTELAL